jgi:predicted transcriptional regulator
MDLKLLQFSPVIFKNDNLLTVKNEMNKSGLFELPVVDEESIIGTITAKGIINFLKKTMVNIESLLAHHLLEKNFLLVNLSIGFSELARKFINTKRAIACFIEKNTFVGFLPRKNLLSQLLENKEPIKPFISKDYEMIRGDCGIKKIVKIVKKEKPVLVYEEKPIVAFSPEELYFLIFINDYLLKKIERDFETLRAEKRKELKFRLNQLLLSLKKREINSFLPQFKISDIAKPLTVEENTSMGEVAKIMIENKRSCLAVLPEGVITDLDLLKALV